MYKRLEAERQYGTEGKGFKQPAGLEIFGSDIQLPVTADSDVAFAGRTYSFFVSVPIAVLNKYTNSAWALWTSGNLTIDVLGAKANCSIPNYLPPDLASNSIAANTVRSRTVEVKIKSDDIHGPFRIEAALPKEFSDFEEHRDRVEETNRETNPFKSSREVRVYYGDLRTRVEIASQDEAAASFGAQFARYFYVGRVFLRNRNHEKRLLVYTTSLRANVLLYRPPTTNINQIPNRDLTPNDKERIDKLQKDRDNRITKSLLATQTGHLIDAALQNYAAASMHAATGRTGEASRVVHASLLKRTSPLEPNQPIDIPDDNKSRIESARMVVLSVWEACDVEIPKLRTDATATLLEAKHQANLLAARLRSEDFSPQIAGTNTLSWLLSWGVDAPLDSLREIDDFKAQLAHLQQQARDIAGQFQYIKDTNISAASIRTINEISSQITEAIEDRSSSVGLARSKPELLAGSNYLAWRANLERRLSPATATGGSDGFTINPEPREWAYSPSPDLQLAATTNGYLWRDSFRPMTFQSVLNALMFSYESNPRTQTIEILQGIAAVLGGISTVGSKGFDAGVSVFSSIFIPQLGKLILEDLNKHIRNLGEMGMDTVVVIPPNDSVDRYIFFPRGPIYNFVNELNVGNPAYIVTVDNDDVSVEATLIDSGVAVRGGALDASTLTDRALNEGVAEDNAELLKRASLKDQYRKADLASLTKLIESLIEAAGTNSVRLASVKTTVCKLVKSFETQNGADQSGVLDALLTTYDIDCDREKPVVHTNQFRTIKLLPGIRSVDVPFPIEPPGSGQDYQFGFSPKNVDLIPVTNVVAKSIEAANRSYVYSILAKTNAL